MKGSYHFLAQGYPVMSHGHWNESLQRDQQSPQSETAHFLTLPSHLRLCEIRPLITLLRHLLHTLVHYTPTAETVFPQPECSQTFFLPLYPLFLLPGRLPNSTFAEWILFYLFRDVFGHSVWRTPSNSHFSILMVTLDFPYGSFC